MAAPIADPSLLRELVIANRILAGEGVLDAFGHISFRVPDHPNRYVIARSIGPECVLEGDLQLYTLEGERLGGNDQAGYAERAIHGAIYLARPDVLSICHNHAPSIIPFGITNVPLRPIFHMAGLLGTEVPVWEPQDEFEETDMLVRSLDQGASLARTLGSRRVALMRGHGSVVAGQAIREVVMNAVFMERNARLQMQAMAMHADVRYLSNGEIERTWTWLRENLSRDRAWETWAARTGLKP